MTNKLAVITGAASGIGLALAKACIQDHMHVVMVDVNEEALMLQAGHLQAFAKTDVVSMVCDVTHADQVRQLAKQTFERFEKIDLLINNAGIIGQLAPVWELSAEHIRHVMDVNLYGVLHGVQAFMPYFLEQSHASHIVNMASFYGLCSGSQLAAYAMSKHAIVALSESLYFDLRRLNKSVDVSVVCPSFTNTNLLLHSEPENGSALHRKVGQLLEHSRPVDDVAESIMRGIQSKTFYILPDKEVKNDCEQRTKAMIEQTMPYEHNLEKILAALSKKHGKAGMD